VLIRPGVASESQSGMTFHPARIPRPPPAV
jgi:hypothetical protein